MHVSAHQKIFRYLVNIFHLSVLLMISQIILKYDIQARRCAQILCSRMWFTQSETAPLCPGLFFYIHRFWQSLFGSCPSFPKTGILLFSEMPVILSLEDHCNRFP